MDTKAYLAQIWTLVRPYRTRLVLGVLCGFLSGLANPLLMVAVKVATEAVFPQASSGVAASGATNAPALGTAGTMASGAAAAPGSGMTKAPEFVQKGLATISSWLPKKAAPSTTLVVVLVSTIPLAMLLRGVLTYLNVYLMTWVAIRAINDLRTRLFSHLLGLSLGFFNRTSTGELITHLNNSAVIQNTICTSFTTIIREPIAILSLLGLLVYQQPKLTLISMLVFPVCIIPVVVYGRKVRKSATGFQVESIRLTDLMYESFTGYRVVKAYNLEETLAGRFRTRSRAFINHYMRMHRATEIPGPMIEFAGSVGVALFILYIALVTKQTPGDFLQFLGSVFLMYAPIKALTRLHNQLNQSRIVCDGLFKLLETTTSVPEPARPRPLAAAAAAIQFEHVDFDYGDKPVLRDVTLKVMPGQMVALVGASGSGKTTLTNLLLRFYDPKGGSVQIGGVDIREVSTHDLRSQMAIVTQETILFNDTIRRNIELGRPGASDAEIEQAARHAHAWEFIQERPEGLDTVVGERGMTLSGGQRQRLAIARAILRNAPILLLDEATSALDTESERAVQAALDTLMQQRTTLCIAHRLSTIIHADLIVVLADGRIVETGTHDELIQRGGHYKKLHDRQFSA